jgi:hypothetical protein
LTRLKRTSSSFIPASSRMRDTVARVVLQVLVADGVVSRRAKHRRHVRLFEVPDAVCGEAVANV